MMYSNYCLYVDSKVLLKCHHLWRYSWDLVKVICYDVVNIFYNFYLLVLGVQYFKKIVLFQDHLLKSVLSSGSFVFISAQTCFQELWFLLDFVFLSFKFEQALLKGYGLWRSRCFCLSLSKVDEVAFNVFCLIGHAYTFL